ncbi:CRISPR-associated nuclease/helicase Cas3 [Austwickia sp. TVS 96-490-7B]|uniref:CRISPR-associated helicase Cas3' n=1 Tax=Austwickia sp. TVS 96-490-7B TaxID=2830843 RepID=UPI001C55ECBD|nr:CRISPR-associated helicase Cas3' [Austwickia sp. TVS 96-490-7B]MBW3084711.1 CRISPR-associated nuclease/helicase Cas3 [Austwickia sp. TVS 96-490-7B]
MAGVHGMPSWSPGASALWGKTDTDDAWLPLWRHLADASQVAMMLWDNWLPASAKDHIASSLPGGHDDGRILLAWLAGVHDIGKATPAFQIKAQVIAPHLTNRLHSLGFDLAVPMADTRRAPHAALGQIILLDWLAATFGLKGRQFRRAAKSLTVAVAAHHGAMLTATELEALTHRPHYLGQQQVWQDTRAELLNAISERTGAADRLDRWLAKPLPPTVQSLLAAAVVVADWLSSDAHRFPYVDRSPEPPRWEQIGLPAPWKPTNLVRDPDALLTTRFPTLVGCSPTPIQQAAVEAAWSAQRPPLILLEAEMGSGKTEAGLAAAEILAHRFGQGGVFVALPTMATSDAMFSRVRSWIDHLPAEDGHHALPMFLAHGKAGLNDDYRSLPDDTRFTGVYDDVEDVSKMKPPLSKVKPSHDEAEPRHAVAVVNSWTRGRRRGVLAPFVVGTIDQVLFGALRSKHLALRHHGLSSKVVVIDEVHAADVYMREYLTSILSWLGAYGTPVVLMSATLPSSQRAELMSAYAEGAAFSSEATATIPLIEAHNPVVYPRTIVFDGTLREIPTEQISSRPRTVTVEEHPDDLDHLVDMLRTEMRDGGCVAVIRNTVRRAQETWSALREAMPETELVLAHSRFLAVDRARRESDLRERLGRSSSVTDGTRPTRMVVVGTQVLEQSLDIDVDLMVSDLAPVDLLLQRIGRLHRHPRGPGESERPVALRAPRLLLLARDWSAVPVQADSGSKLVYGEDLLFRAAATLRAHGNQIRLAEDIPVLVEAAYSTDLSIPPGWQTAWATADARRQAQVLAARSRASTFRLSGFGKKEALRRSAGLLADCGFFEIGDPDDGNGGRSQVRDSEDSIEVIVVRLVDGQIRPMPGAGLPTETVLDTDFPPEPRIARALAGCTVRLPSWACMRDLDAVICALEDIAFAGWQQDCPWLQGQLVLVMDEHGHARVADLDLTYSSEMGLTVTTHQEDV